MKNQQIDFVIIWVDGGDAKWLAEKAKYSSGQVRTANVDDSTTRYRDWDNLQYWFRGVEKFAPWVHKIHFVTCGHLPDWLDLSNPKLNVIKHEDFIPKEYLPTFSSHPIELNLHRIKGLSERFVYFNDDTFIINKITPAMFFSGQFPKYRAILNAIVPAGDKSDLMPDIYVNNTRIINRHFNKTKVINENFTKWINPRYGIGANLRTMLNMPYDGFTGMYFDHLPAPFLKSTFRAVWKAEPDVLRSVSSHRFRSDRDVNQYLMRAWQICTGSFEPMKIRNVGRAYFLPNSYDSLKRTIENQGCSMVCINDSGDIDNFEVQRAGVVNSFEQILSERSSFEK